VIKSLYLRVVIVFLIVVFISLVLAFFVTSQLFNNTMMNSIQEDQLEIGVQVVQMARELDPKNLDSFIKRFSELKNGSNFQLYDDSARRILFYGTQGSSSKVINLITQTDISYVLAGNTYRSLDYRSVHESVQLVAGLPLEHEGKKYALFISPNFKGKPDEKNKQMIKTSLFIVLLAGSMLILIASRYIVNPLKKLTEATKRLACGDFDVNVPIKHKDELGQLAVSFNHMAGELKQLEHMRQNFVSNVSHEIQSPLTSIRGFSKALRQPDLTEANKNKYLEIIESESERLSRLSENLLKLASLESEHHPFHPVTFDLDEQLRMVVVSHEPQWSELHMELDVDLPRVKITADADQLNQVWINLLGNAIKFTPAYGKIRVSLEPLTDRVIVLIQDTGIGINEEDRERIFERFYKGDRARQRETGSNGLGLAIVKRIVDLHHGTIDVQSEPGKGTVFKVTLPILSYHSRKV
jgi:signal transduction histidine kinase